MEKEMRYLVFNSTVENEEIKALYIGCYDCLEQVGKSIKAYCDYHKKSFDFLIKAVPAAEVPSAQVITADSILQQKEMEE